MSDYQEQSAFWRAAIELHEHSGQSIRGFCRAEGLKEHLFYRWRKQLGLSPTLERSRLVQPPGSSERPATAPLPGAIESSAKDASALPSSFVPIKVQPPASPPLPEVSSTHSSTHSVQIRLPNGIELAVAGADLPTLLCDLLQAC